MLPAAEVAGDSTESRVTFLFSFFGKHSHGGIRYGMSSPKFALPLQYDNIFATKKTRRERDGVK